MYKRLLSLVNNFIHVERAHLGQKIHCKLIEVAQDTLEIQTYTQEGQEDTRWILPLASVTGIAVQSPDIDRLALKVKWAQSPDDAEKALQETPSDVTAS